MLGELENLLRQVPRYRAFLDINHGIYDAAYPKMSTSPAIKQLKHGLALTKKMLCARVKKVSTLFQTSASKGAWTQPQQTLELVTHVHRKLVSQFMGM